MTERTSITCPAGIPLMQYLIRSGRHIQSSCGGRGNCGKCLVRVLEPDFPISTMDRIQLTDSQLADGIRMACQIMPKKDLEVEIIRL